jgi:hypothetical protein
MTLASIERLSRRGEQLTKALIAGAPSLSRHVFKTSRLAELSSKKAR